MRTKIYYVLGAICLLAGITLLGSLLKTSGAVRTRSAVFSENADMRGVVESIYEVSFVYPKKTPEYVSLFIPDYGFLSKEDSGFYPALMGLTYEPAEYDEYYEYIGDGFDLRVYKYLNRLFYEREVPAASAPVIDDSGIIALAAEFVNESMLPFDYDFAEVDRFGGKGEYTVTFVTKLNNMPNYAHPTVVRLNAEGDVIELDYYCLLYEKLTSIRVISMREAFYNLPVDFEPGIKVDLNRCELVYIFADSILQPAYMFTGELVRQDGNIEPFVHYINAALYQ